MIPEPLKKSTQLEILNKNLFAILYSISPVEPKSLDNVLIENIGFQLRAKPMVLAKLLGTEDLRANLAPARAFEVSKLIYIAQADTDGAAEKYIHIAEDAAAALHHYGAGADAVELRLIAGAQTEIPACNGLQVKIVPANKAPEETMQQILQGVEILDLTNGQEDLCTLAGIYAECDMIVKRDGTFRALRGKVPAQLPIPQPWDVDGLFRLSGAMPHKEEDTQTKIDYEKVNTLYRQILENFGRAAFYDICRDFAEAYSKQSTTYFSQMAGPDAQMQTYTMPTERWEELEPLLRKLQKYKYIRNLTSMVKAGQAKIAFMAGQKCAASLDYKKLANTIKNNPVPNSETIRVVSEFFGNWECGLGWLDAPNKRSEKLPYRVIRHLFFLILGLDDPLYGSAEDMRTLLIQLGFALGMRSTEIDELLKDSGLSGLAYNTNEIILAYAADHFDDSAYLHARALQKIYEVQSQIVPQNKADKPDILELKQTAFYRYNYTNSGWSELKPADFLQQCRDDNIAWRRVQDLINPPKQRKNSSLQAKAASAELQEQSERMTNIVVYSSQLFEIRKILIDLYLQAKIRMANGDAEQTTYEEQYDRIDRAYGNKLLSLDHNTSFKKGSNGWKEFLQWDKEIKDSMVAKFVALYPYEELAVIQNSKNDGISRRQQLNNRVKYAEACLQDSKWLLRDDFLRLAFLDYLVTEPPENSDKEKKDSMEIIRDFANREGPILERCRLKPYDPDKDALTQDFVRTLENK